MLDQINQSSSKESTISMDVASELPSSIKTYLRSSQFHVTSMSHLNDTGDFIAADVNERGEEKTRSEISFDAVEQES